MSNWGEEYDEELKNHERVNVKLRFGLNFKYLSQMLDKIDEETREWDEKYPKSELIKIWACIMLNFLLLFSLSYNVFIIVTGAFYIFYTYSLFQTYGKWKRFRYSRIQFWTATVVVLTIMFIVGGVIRRWVFY